MSRRSGGSSLLNAVIGLGLAGLVIHAVNGHLPSALSGGGASQPVHATEAGIVWPGGTSYTAQSWARAFLASARLPAKGCDLAAVEAWQHAEGSNPAWHNPLDTTQPWPRGNPASHGINSKNVQSYPDVRSGLAATVHTLYNGRYGPVVAALRTNNSAQQVADAVAASPWGTQPFTASC
jgi:hypothetical protein